MRKTRKVDNKALFVNLCPLYVTDMRYLEEFPELNVSFYL